jgi:hypothetical protein
MEVHQVADHTRDQCEYRKQHDDTEQFSPETAT